MRFNPPIHLNFLTARTNTAEEKYLGEESESPEYHFITYLEIFSLPAGCDNSVVLQGSALNSLVPIERDIAPGLSPRRIIDETGF